MKKARRKGQKAMTVAIYLLLITWIVLLALLITIYVLRLQGYDNFKEWKNRNEVQENIVPSIITPEATQTPVPTEVIEPTENPKPTAEAAPTATPIVTATPEPTATPTVTATPEPTATPVPTATPTPTEAAEPIVNVSNGEVQTIETKQLVNTVFTGSIGIDDDIRRQAAEFAGEENTISYQAYQVENYASIVFEKQDGHLLPLVYDLSAKKQVTGSEFIRETYMAVVKERLQKVVAEKFPELKKDNFISYDMPYQVSDYEQFYLTDTELVFYFDETTLTEKEHPAFTYKVELEEAMAFSYFNLDGTASGLAIRELDPSKPMVAITYDDGPYQKVETKLMELFQQYDGRATFFVVANRVDGTESRYDKWLKQLYENGFEIGSHSYSHPYLHQVGVDVFWQEVNKANLVIGKTTGFAPTLIRLPGGHKTDYILENIPMPMMHWNVDSLDYAEKAKEDGPQIIFDRIKGQVNDGSIILMHSIYENSYKASELLLPWLVEQGYQLVTISELYYYRNAPLEQGETYYGFWR